MVTKTDGFGSAQRAAYASDPARSRGRLEEEAPSPTRTEFQRDRDRILHSTAFRRLREKTQVFLVDEGDHYRTRLTHTLEVSQIARAIARTLRLDEDLAEALALAHDLGHPPFGHAGERALNAEMADFGGFDHNAQSVRVVTLLERRYPRFDGLNLTWESIEGLVKHNGPLMDRSGQPVGPYRGSGIPPVIADYSARADLWLWSLPGPEAQAAAIADDIAYDAHDIDDGLRAGMLTLDRLGEVELTAGMIRQIRAEFPGLEPVRAGHELVRRLIAAMVEDVVGEAWSGLEQVRASSPDDIRKAPAPVIRFSPAMVEADRGIKALLHRTVYRNEAVMRVMNEAESVVRKLFRRYMEEPEAVPPDWRPPPGSSHAARARRVCDFLAGMTDRYAMMEYARLFGRGGGQV
ncbi:MAG TPA: deoxyguanosinetriphosphate triphosphohydrolase [Bauldia sp.]|nr:deoxyguanosinetriphosphate triphosphohydrolase [Bauldia sp.]